MELKIGQEWISDSHPHENFQIYGGIYDTYSEVEFDKLPESNKIYFWERTNEQAFDNFIKKVKGKSVSDLIKEDRNTFPYAWAGECKKQSLVNKIKKYNMKLKQDY